MKNLLTIISLLFLISCSTSDEIQNIDSTLQKSYEPNQNERIFTSGTTDFKMISGNTSAVFIDEEHVYNYGYTSTAQPILNRFPEENRMEITFNNNYGSKIVLNNISKNGKSFDLSVVINGVATNPLPFKTN